MWSNLKLQNGQDTFSYSEGLFCKETFNDESCNYIRNNFAKCAYL